MRYARYIPLLIILLNVALPARVCAQPIGTQPDINVFVRAGWNTQILNNPTGFLSVEPPGADVAHSFHLAHARLYINGMLDDRIGYDIKTDLVEDGVVVTSTVSCVDRTGVEMEALTAVSVAALTIYDMCKAVDRGMEISSIGLLQKEGGKSGLWRRGVEGAP